MTNERTELLEALRELGTLYPPFRFGQMLCFAATLTDSGRPELPRDVADQAMLVGVRAHLEKRRKLGPVEGHDDIPGLLPTRTELIESLKRLEPDDSECSLGTQVSEMADACKETVYDIEDERLLSIANEQRGFDLEEAERTLAEEKNQGRSLKDIWRDLLA